jgi:hypothetical protein
MLLELAQDPRERRVVVVVVLPTVVLLLATMVLLPAVVLLPSMVRLLVMRLLLSRVATATATVSGVVASVATARRDGLTALEVDVDTTSVLLRPVLQAHLAAQLLNLGLELLDVARGVVALANNGVQVRLAAGAVCADPLLEDALGLLDELTVQVNAVLLDAPVGVVLAEDELRGLAVVVVHLAIVGLALVGQLLGRGAVAVRVGLSRLRNRPV